MSKHYFSIGLMSGSSLDGLDICFSKIYCDEDNYYFEIIASKTYPYTSEIVKKLRSCRDLSSFELQLLDVLLGKLFGSLVLGFIKEMDIKNSIDFIANHGHTVFHFPEKGFTLQIGNSFYLSKATKIPVVGNLREKDVIFGGQGAPIVPITDLYLFKKYKFCINFGGISNISIKNDESKNIEAFDICVCNQLLNYYANKLGYEYDKSGLMAKAGCLNQYLLDELNRLSFYEIIHIAQQISKVVIENGNDGIILSTGGGTHNLFLIESIQSIIGSKIVVPNKEIIDFKEALAMSFMGVRFMENKFNVLSSVTGASKNTISGVLYMP